jgi:hypothetical protein
LHEKEGMQKIYEEFTKEYSIEIDGGDKLIVAWELDDITITPATGKIKYITTLKPESELEMKFRQGNLGECNCLRFKTKDKKEIIVRQSY